MHSYSTPVLSALIALVVLTPFGVVNAQALPGSAPAPLPGIPGFSPVPPTPPLPEVPNPTITLTSITLDGTMIAGFEEGRNTYAIELAQGAAVPTVAAAVTPVGQTITATQAADVPGTATISFEGRTITISFTRQQVVETPAPQEPSRGGGGGGGSSRKTSRSSSSERSAPTGADITIARGAASTNTRTVSLALYAKDSSSMKMRISQDSDFSDAKWVSYKTRATYTLSGLAGEKTLYAEFMDANKNVSSVTADSIVLSAKGALEKDPGMSKGSVASANRYVFSLDLKLGSRGTEVSELQKRLLAEQAYAKPVTGVFNLDTALALARYQSANALPRTAKLDQNTRLYLNGKSVTTAKPKGTSTVSTTKQKVSNERISISSSLYFGTENGEVSFLQQRLAQVGVYQGPVTGYYGALTQAAVKRYQAQSGLTVTGALDAATRTHLNNY